jgi:hypothetical protein
MTGKTDDRVEKAMTYKVHVQGRAVAILFDTYSSAGDYRRAMLAAGRFARLTSS